MIVNVNRVVQVVHDDSARGDPGRRRHQPRRWQGRRGGDRDAIRHAPRWLLSPLGAPCTAPPWGELVAVDLLDGDVRWRVPLGSIEKQLPIRFEWNLGTPSLGGPIVTAGGLVFIAGTMDGFLRAFDIETGEMLWRHEMPAGTQATPMTYEVERPPVRRARHGASPVVRHARRRRGDRVRVAATTQIAARHWRSCAQRGDSVTCSLAQVAAEETRRVYAGGG